MNDDLKQRVLALDAHEWLLLLSRLSHHVTVLLRDCYPHVVNGDPPPDDYENWQWLNELMHDLTGQLAARLDPRPWGRYPDDVHLDAIFERAARAASVADLAGAYEDIVHNLELKRPKGA